MESIPLSFSENEMFDSLNCAYWESKRRNKKREWRKKSADEYVIFAWYNYNPDILSDWILQTPRRPVWVKYAPPLTERNVLMSLNKKKPIVKKILNSQEWLGEKVMSDIQFFKYFSENAVMESIYKNRFISYKFSGTKVNEDKTQIKPELDLRVIVSPSLFVRCFLQL